MADRQESRSTNRGCSVSQEQRAEGPSKGAVRGAAEQDRTATFALLLTHFEGFLLERVAVVVFLVSAIRRLPRGRLLASAVCRASYPSPASLDAGSVFERTDCQVTALRAVEGAIVIHDSH